MKGAPEVRIDIPSPEVFEALVGAPLPLALRSTPVERRFHRDVYFDTADRALEKRGITCRLRIRSDDVRVLSLRIGSSSDRARGAAGDERFEAIVSTVDPRDALAGPSEPARRLQAIVDPSRLKPRTELETERHVRRARGGVLPLPRYELAYDIVTVRNRDSTEVFRELKIRSLRRGGRGLGELANALQADYSLHVILATKLERAETRLKALESEAFARVTQGQKEVSLLAFNDSRLAVLFDGRTLKLPAQAGSGEAAARHVLRSLFGSAEGEFRLVGQAAGTGTRPILEVWLALRLAQDAVRDAAGSIQWISLDEVMARVGSPVLRDPRTVAALAVGSRSGLLPASSTGEHPARRSRRRPTDEIRTLSDLQKPDLPKAALDVDRRGPDQYINAELSWLEFNTRVLALAEDPGTPLLARLRFLAIFSSNLDEFFMIRVGALKHAVAEGVMDTSVDGLTPDEELDAISVRLPAIIERQRRCFERSCLPDLERRGIRLRRWDQLSDEQRVSMRRYFDQRIFPVLTPQAMTQAPGHPFPRIANLSLSLAIMVRDPQGGPPHFAHVKVPGGLPRFIPVEDGTTFVPVEAIIAANLEALYPGRRVEEVHPFRITRSADIRVDEEGVENLLHAIEEGVRQRPFGSVVRIEVAHSMPGTMRDLLERELSLEEAGDVATLSDADIFEAAGLVDPSALDELASLDLPELDYPPFEGGNPLDRNRSVFDLLKERDLLVHHPYDAFESTVQRFIVQAAQDPDVLAIKMTLYRGGSRSAIVEALGAAAAAGKDVSVFVELKARFDEERNIRWAKTLEQAGIHVVYGLVRLKTHAKTALVVRREGEAVRRYVHIGTGNYNAATAKFYTDLGLLSANEELGADLNDLFNELIGSSGPPGRELRRLVVAPTHMLQRFLALIDRETDHARAGRGGRIRAKLNGLADKDIIAALYRASQAGVETNLIVRGICSLRPGVPGLSERIRVFSILGRFLEHARIYYFANGGEPEYYIGSADWRPRNLRRRVEVVAPVLDGESRRRLEELLEAELEDPTAWQMRSDGGYDRAPLATGVEYRSAQERFMERVAAHRDGASENAPAPRAD